MSESLIASDSLPPPVNYSLRPAKNIQRKMMVEALGRLNGLAPLASYRYVGFGSEFFNDFVLYHQRLGIRDMVSMERDPARLDRCRFNRPYRSIRVLAGTASEVLPTLSWRKRSIVWLDYMDQLGESILDDVRFVLSEARSGSALIWSINVHPYDKGRESEWPERRLEQLIDNVGDTRVPSGLRGADLAQWGLADMSYNILKEEIGRALLDRNSALLVAQQVAFQQWFHFRYADGQKMMTVGGVLLNEADAAALSVRVIDDHLFARSGADSFDVAPPLVTGREARFLNRRLPLGRGRSPQLDWLPQADIEAYAKVYRYFPLFAESEL